MKWLIAIAVMLLSIGAQAAEPEIIITDNSVQLFGYRRLDVPKNVQREDCGAYGFSDTSFKSAENGQYASEGSIFLIEDNWLLPQSGSSKLTNGAMVEFYSEDDFSENGQRVYIQENGIYKRLPDGDYKLTNGQDFKVVKGYIDDYGGFADGRIYHEDRD